MKTVATVLMATVLALAAGCGDKPKDCDKCCPKCTEVKEQKKGCDCCKPSCTCKPGKLNADCECYPCDCGK